MLETRQTGGGERIAGREVTPRDVARRAGVHVSTASGALDDGREARIGPATIERVRNAAAELGCSRDLLASGLKRGETKTIGVVVADLDNPHDAPVIRGIAAGLETADFVPLVAETGRRRGPAIRSLPDPSEAGGRLVPLPASLVVRRSTGPLA